MAMPRAQSSLRVRSARPISSLECPLPASGEHSTNAQSSNEGNVINWTVPLNRICSGYAMAMREVGSTGKTEFATQSVHTLTEEQIDQVLALFDAAYDDADHSYLLSSFEVMGWIALATSGPMLAGFAIGDAKLVKLPRLEGPCPVAIHGIGCIDENFRRLGLFSRLEKAVVGASGALQPGCNHLHCGRTAHPATYRFLQNIGVGGLPDPGRVLSPWHTETVAAIAELYDATVYPGTCIVIGKGKPIGFPRVHVEASEAELSLFKDVDRNRGDALLAMSWSPQAPAGW